MAAGFSVKDALNKNSKAGIDESPRARFRTKDISIFKMYRNDMNFYSVADIEELAGDILLSGLKQNLELVYAPCEKGEYRIVAGERRWEALKYLVSKGYKDFELATSKLTTPQDDDEEQVEIIIANSYRSKTISDMIEEETRLKASLERMKAAGKKIKGYDLQSGRLRDVISSMLHVSKTKIAQIEAINNNLIPGWKEELKKERLTFSAAYELSGMTEDEQRETLGKFSETGELTHKEVKDMQFLSILKYCIGFMQHPVVSFLTLYVCLNLLRRRIVWSIKNIFYQSFHRIWLSSVFRVLNHGRQGLYKL